MIVPMKKVSLIIMGDQKSETLKRLRKLGILHIEAVEGSGKMLEELKSNVALLESALFSISDKKNAGKCGEISNIYKNGIGVCTGDLEVILTSIKPFGKKRMDAASYLNGVDKKSLIGKVFE